MAVMAHGSFSPEEELLSPESVATAATVLYICLVFSECKTTVQDDCKSSSSQGAMALGNYTQDW